MEESDIHHDIKTKLKTFIVEKKIPHIIFMVRLVLEKDTYCDIS